MSRPVHAVWFTCDGFIGESSMCFLGTKPEIRTALRLLYPAHVVTRFELHAPRNNFAQDARAITRRLSKDANNRKGILNDHVVTVLADASGVARQVKPPPRVKP